MVSKLAVVPGDRNASHKLWVLGLWSLYAGLWESAVLLVRQVLSAIHVVVALANSTNSHLYHLTPIRWKASALLLISSFPQRPCPVHNNRGKSVCVYICRWSPGPTSMAAVWRPVSTPDRFWNAPKGGSRGYRQPKAPVSLEVLYPCLLTCLLTYIDPW
jgi:hypothetical protein